MGVRGIDSLRQWTGFSFACKSFNWGPDHAYIGWTVTRLCRSSELGTLKSGQYGCGHVGAQMSGVRDLAHARCTEMMGASPGHHDARTPPPPLPPMCFVRCDLSHRRCGEGGGWRSVMAGLGIADRPWQVLTRLDRRVSNTERWPTFYPERWDERDELCLGSGCSER